MKSVVLFLMCGGLILGSAAYRGRLDAGAEARVQEALQAASERVKSAPKTVGEWVGEDREVDENALRRGGAAAYVSRQYVHRETRERIAVLLMCGKPGPVSVHTPEVCYAGANYAPNDDQRPWSPVADNSLTWASFRSRVDGQSNLEIAWAWTTNGRWHCPEIPRLTFGREPALYKIYFVHEIAERAEPSKTVHDLASQLLPALQPTVFRNDESKSAPSSAAPNTPRPNAARPQTASRTAP